MAGAKPTALGITQVGIEATPGSVVAATHRLPTTFKAKLDPKYLEPKQQRGVFDAYYDVLKLRTEVAWEAKSEFYPATSQWGLLLGVNAAPSIVTNPASPSVLLAATAIGHAMTLTAQPADAAHGRLILTITPSAGQGGGTAVITGAPIGGGAGTTESVVYPATTGTTAAVVTSQKVWNTVSGIDGGSAAGGITLGVQGFTDYAWTYNPSNTIATATFEEFDGTGTWQYPWAFLTDLDLDWTPEKALEIACKGMAQQQIILGSLTNLALPLDQPLTGALAKCSVDPIGATPGTTPYLDVTSYKFSLKNGTKPVNTGTGNRYFDRAARGWTEIEVDLDVDLPLATGEYAAFAADTQRLFQTVISGDPYATGTTGPSLTITTPLKYTTGEIDRTKEFVQAKFKGRAYVDPTFGFSHQVVVHTTKGSY